MKALKIIGWIVVPYIMIFFQWKKIGNKGRAFGIAWALLILIIFFNSEETDPAQEIAAGAQPKANVETNDTSSNDDAEKKKKDDEAAELKEEERLKAEADAKKKEEEDRLAMEEESKTIRSGTHMVGDEIQPGLYKSEGSISYWARVSGFSGELDEIIANGTPSGSWLVEIKSTDKGFQNMGSGKWVLIDDTYDPEILTEFGDGMYIVGKDISPGTYKSSENITYWARLSNFSGETINSIIANGTPSGPEIVEIKQTDVGFQTFGGGTWKLME